MDKRHQYVAELLSNHTPINEREQESMLRAIGYLHTLAQPFSRDADPVHFTAGGLVVSERGTILHLHKKLGIWIGVGGHIDGDEFPYESALREAQEETGLEVEHVGGTPTFLHVDVHPAYEHTHIDLRYVLTAPPIDPQPSSGESQDVKWVSFDEAEQTDDLPMQGALAAYKRLLKSS